MNHIHVALEDEVHETVKALAEERKVSIADILREALEIYAVGLAYAEDGKRLVWEDGQTGNKLEVLIPGFVDAKRRAASRRITFETPTPA